METIFQVIFLIVVMACFTVAFACLADVKKRNRKEPESEQAIKKAREPEKHIRNAEIARAILYGCPASKVQAYFSGYAEEAFLSKSRIYEITRNVCKKCATYPVDSRITMWELRQNKNKFLPHIEEFLGIYGETVHVFENKKTAVAQ